MSNGSISRSLAGLSSRLFPDGPDGNEDEDQTVSLISHDTHFLERTVRFGGAELDRAMSLYHHSSVVRRLLQEQLRDRPEVVRAAIAVSEGQPAAHVIVTRDGNFVTCLSAGMRVGQALVLPFGPFAAALEAEEAQHAQAAVRRRQLVQLLPADLLRALFAGPGELVREMVEVVELQALTYLVPVHLSFSRALRRLNLVDGAQLNLRGLRHPSPAVMKRLNRHGRRADATVRQCLYMFGAMDDPLVTDMLVTIVREPCHMSEDAGAALAMHRDGGRALLELMKDVGVDMLSRCVAAQSLGHHFAYHPRNLPGLSRDLLQAGLPERLFPRDNAEAFQLMSETPVSCMDALRELINEKLGPRPEVPIDSAWLIEGDLRNDLATHGVRVSELFPPRAVAQRVKEAWRRLQGVPLPLFELRQRGRPVVRGGPRVGRNAPCPCGSGAKYKNCCLGVTAPAPVADEGAAAP